MSTPTPAALRIAFATGTNPEKWFRRFRQRTPWQLHTTATDDPLQLLKDSQVDMALIRRDHNDPIDDDSLHRVALYQEAWGVAFEAEHVFSLSSTIALELLDDETILLSSSDPAQLRQMLPVAATGAGVVVGPRPILKNLAKKAVASADVVGSEGDSEPLTRTSIWLVWPRAADDEIRQEFVGVVQGRREHSTRSQLGLDTAAQPAKKLSAREKTLAKQARREAAAGRGGGRGGWPRGGVRGKGRRGK